MNPQYVGHSKKGTVEWYTPQYIIDALGPFDLDPCSAPNPLFKIADKVYTKEDNGLLQPWFGRVWCNPPFNLIDPFFERASRFDTLGICWASTETEWFEKRIWDAATAVLFPYRRVQFLRPDGRIGKSGAGKGAAIVAWGISAAHKLEMAAAIQALPGKFIRLK